MRTWPIIGVKNVEASGDWYRALLGMPERPPAHDDFDQIRDPDGTVLVGLHEWGGHGEGPPLQSPSESDPGNGMLLSILVEDFESCLDRARELEPVFHMEPKYPTDWFRSFALRDPDGYYVAICSLTDIQAIEARSKAVASSSG